MLQVITTLIFIPISFEIENFYEEDRFSLYNLKNKFLDYLYNEIS